MTLFRLLLAGLPLWLLAPAGAVAEEAGALSVSGAWARATPGAAKNGAAYFVLKGAKDSADTLVGGSSPGAGVVEIHTHIEDGGVMKMRKLDKLEVEAGATKVFAPGGLHVMLINLTAPLKEGATLPLTLTFAKAGEVKVEVAVAGIGAAGPAGSGAADASSDAGSHDGSHAGSDDGKGSHHGE